MYSTVYGQRVFERIEIKKKLARNQLNKYIYLHVSFEFLQRLKVIKTKKACPGRRMINEKSI